MFDQNIKILVIDDFLTMRKMVSNALNRLGFKNVVTAKDGDLGWKMLQDDPNIGLVVSDWNMPNMQGIDLLKKVREDEKINNIPFILLTAESEAFQVKQAIEYGVDNYIVKPFSPATLEQKLQQAYRKYSTRLSA